MRYFSCLLLLVLLSGCALIKEIDDRRVNRQKAWEEREAEERRREEEYARVLEYKKNLKPGLRMADVQMVFADPDRTEFVDGKIIHWYDSDEEPIFLVYDSNQILQAKFVDTDTINQRAASRQQRQMQRQLSDIQRQQALQGFAGALQNINTQNQLNSIQQNQVYQQQQIQRQNYQDTSGPVRVNRPGGY